LVEANLDSRPSQLMMAGLYCDRLVEMLDEVVLG
jgi:hypothetical protein